MSVEVTPVSSRPLLREFVEVPFTLHRTSPHWVPPLRLERHAFLSRRVNPFFGHGEARLFLARREGRTVGRVSAHVDHRYAGTEWGLFGFLEVEEDPEALAALLDTAAAWLRARGRTRMVGPFDFTMNDEAGVLVEGFEREPFIRQPWHPPYLHRLCEAAGLGKAVDLLMWEIAITDRPSIRPIVFKLDEQARDEHGIVIRHMTRRSLRRDLDAFADVYNAAWSTNWGFVPYTKADLDGYAHELQLVFDPRWFMVAEKDGEPVGVAITSPDVNQTLQRMQGRLLPLGWWHFLRKGSHIDRVRVGFLGVKPEFQHFGVAAALYVEHFRTAEVARQKWAEMGWILEDNPINKGMSALGGRIVKRFRVYQRDL